MEATMSTTKQLEDQEVNPVIAAQQHLGQSLTELRGFLGKGPEGIIRLYADLNMDSYADIPKDAVVYWQEVTEDQKGEYRVFVPVTTQITEIYSIRLSADRSSFSIQGRIGFRPPPPIHVSPFYDCSRKCEAEYADLVREAQRLETQAGQENRQDIAENLMRRANDLRERASDALNFCVSNCPDRPRWRWERTPEGGYRLVPFSLGAWIAEIMHRNL
jgi:hypothetical protein